jgi:glycosyltransferase involved in cell wall biosynthesis
MTHTSKQSAGRGSRERVAACLIVQNEHKRLPEALASVSFCDEIVVVDGGSIDQTAQVARAAGAKVIENPWPGYAAQRNVALDAANTEWILEVDADERVSPQLRQSIEALMERGSPEVEITVFALRNRFLGKLLGPSAKYPAYRTRLFRRDAYRHDETHPVHEGIEPRGRPAVLDGDLQHELAGTLREALLDTWRYAHLEARRVQRPSKAYAYAIGIALRPMAKIGYRLVVDGGWRDGWQGLLKIVLDACGDALVWTLVLLGVPPHEATIEPTPEQRRPTHFGRRPVGPPKVVALAGSPAAARTARTWLAGLGEADVDVALICDDPGADPRIPQQRVRGLRLLATMRALDLEMQVRTIDAVVTVGLRARLTASMLPKTLRPKIAGLTAKSTFEAAARLTYEAVAPSRLS